MLYLLYNKIDIFFCCCKILKVWIFINWFNLFGEIKVGFIFLGRWVELIIIILLVFFLLNFVWKYFKKMLSKKVGLDLIFWVEWFILSLWIFGIYII